MSQDSIAFFKAKLFAIRIINLHKHLRNSKNEHVMSKQILRSGTSIGANLAEAVCGISDKDFLSKVYVALKECSETRYWLELLMATEYISKSEYDSIFADCMELYKLLMATARTMNKKDIF